MIISNTSTHPSSGTTNLLPSTLTCDTTHSTPSTSTSLTDPTTRSISYSSFVNPVRPSYASHILACPGTLTSSKSILMVLLSTTSLNRSTRIGSSTFKSKINIPSTKSTRWIPPISQTRFTPEYAAVHGVVEVGSCTWTFWTTSVYLKGW